VLQGLTYTVDASGLRTEIAETRPGTTTPITRSSVYTYDEVKRLTREQVTGSNSQNRTSSWTYDRVGNRKSESSNGGVFKSLTYTYDANDRLTREQGSPATFDYVYDAAGNLLQKKQGSTVVASYRWSAEGRMLGATLGTGVSQIVTSYQYDPSGIRRSQDAVSAGLRSRTDYLVDPNQAYAQVLEDWEASGPSANPLPTAMLGNVYIHGDDLISQTLLANNQATSTQVYHYDGLGSTRALSQFAVDASGNPLASHGQVSDRYAYTAFGEADPAGTSGNNTNATENAYRYTGEQLDPNLGFYYLRARYMDPRGGRFLGMDSFAGWAADPGSLHKYTYAHSDPVNNTDPTGNFSLGQAMAAVGSVANLALVAYSSYEFGGQLYLMGTGQKEISPREVGIAIIWAYAGSKAGLLVKGFERVLRRSGCLSNSFTSDTLVQTKDGLKPIAEIQEGELVLSRNPDTGEDEYQAVSAVMSSTGRKDLVNITLESGEVIRATPEHLMFVEGGLAEARDVRVGTLLITDEGFASVTAVQTNTAEVAVFDLTIENNRNFFVTASRVLVHNISPCEKAAQAVAKVAARACQGVRGSCIQYVEDLERRLLQNKMNGKRLCVRSAGGVGAPYSDTVGSLGDNSFHYAVQVGEMVFDNMRPDGIPISEWVNDLGGAQYVGGSGSGAPLELIEQQMGSPFNCARR
jgi:RHS repeat-associated protein